MTGMGRISGGSGTYGVANTTQLTRISFCAIQVNADCVISELTYSEAYQGTTNALTNLNLGTTTWAAGIVIFAPMGTMFKSITLTSGSVLVS